MKFLFFFLFLPVFAAESITESTLFPVDFQRGSYSITENHPYVLIPKIKGDRNALRTNPPDFVMELPESVKIIRVCTRVAPQKDIPYSSEKITRRDEKFQRWKIRIPAGEINRIRPSSYPWRAGFYLYIQADKGSAGRSFPVIYRIEQQEKIIRSGNFLLDILPEIKAPDKALRHFRIGMCHFSGAGHPDNSVLKKQIGFWTALASKPYTSFTWEHYRMPDGNIALLDRDCEFFAYSYACGHSTMILEGGACNDLGFRVNGKVTRPGVPLFTDRNGKVNPGAICPQYLMSDPEGLFYGDYLRRSVEKMKQHTQGINTFIIDYEPNADGGTCNACLKAFAEFAGLPAIPSRSEIVPGKTLNRKWKEYKVHQNKIIMGKIADGIRRHFPGMKFSFCCTELRPSSEAVNTWDAVDAAAMDQKTDFFSFMIYSSGTTYYDYLKYAADHLKHARAFPWIDPAEEHERFFVRYSPEKIRQNMIATIALNAMGIMFYPIDTMDGRNLTMINGTAAVIAELEDIYEGRNLSKQVQWQIRNAEIINVFDDKGKYSKVEYPDLSSRIKVHLHEKNGRYVLSILNYASETGLLQIAIPDFAGSPSVKVADMIRKKSYSGITADQIRNGFVVEVPAGDSSIFRISEENAPYPEITQAELQEKLKMFQQGQERNNPLDRSRQNGSRAVQWRIFKKKPMPTLINGEHYITINPGENARIEEWSSGRFTPIGQPKGSLGELNFLDPSQASSHEYAVVDFSLNGTLPYLTFRSSVLPDTSAVGNANPLTGLIMEKRIALDDSGSITMTDTFRNPTENTMRFAFRIKNIPYSVWKAGSNPVVMLKEQEAIPGTYLKKGCRINWYAANQITYFQGEPSVSLITGNRQIRLIFPHAAGVFFWKNQTLHTVEPLYEELILKSGESKSFTQKISAVYKDGKQ